MKPIISLQESHDTSLTVYHEGKFYHFEFERYSGHKHHHVLRIFPGKLIITNRFTLDDDHCRKCYDVNTSTLEKILKLLKRQFKIENKFSNFLYKGFMLKKENEFYSNYRNLVNFENFQVCQTQHHHLHVLSSYVQSPFDKCFAISYDAGGDNYAFVTAKIDDYDNINYKNKKIYFGHMYNSAGHLCKILSKTSRYDIAGKLMGLCAYSDEINEELLEIFNRYIFYPSAGGVVYRFPDDKLVKFKELQKCVTKNNIEDVVIASTAQHSFSQNFFKIFEELLPEIESQSNNLIMSGGCSLNVLINHEIKKRYPHINIFVPPNPHDSNLSIGMIVQQLKPKNKHDLTYTGSFLEDLPDMIDYIKEKRCEEISLDYLVKLLRSGKIIGFLNNRCEVGPRALGNRSILCDASYKNMKQILNEKVKFREWFRPFAPVCVLEDAAKYFESPDFNNMNMMSFVVNVKQEYREKLSSITHVDGTARLQTVERKDNSILYNLLKKFDGVLLNTSFNVQGKPILNDIKTALYVLKNTQLDFVVVCFKNKFYLFNG